MSPQPSDPPSATFGERGEVTFQLIRWRRGDQDAADQLLPLVYEELRKAAVVCLKRERQGHTLQTSDLLHELYLRLFDATVLDVADRNHFLSVAARVMRRILVDYARAQAAKKRAGPMQRLPLEEAWLEPDQRAATIRDIDLALDALRTEYPDHASVVELRFFGGFSENETAEILDKSRSSVSRSWRFAKLWLRHHINTSEQPAGSRSDSKAPAPD